MKVFVYEYITGGGTWTSGGKIEPDGSLLAEGAAMARAIISDFTAISGTHVLSMFDARLEGRLDLPTSAETVCSASQAESVFEDLVRRADVTLLIAPEIGGCLLECCRRVESLGGRLISPDSPFVAIAADKQATAERLSGHGVRTPPGIRLDMQAQDLDPSLFPAVVKPCDGAGSWMVARIQDAATLRHLLRSGDFPLELRRGNLRLERFVPGTAASVAVLCGPGEPIALEPCEQVLSNDRFTYLGGRLPLPACLAERAQRLAHAAVAALPATTGYVGIDVVLGDADDGSQDHVLDVNPRLTTSYVGLRAASCGNLAAAMLAVAAGRPAALSFSHKPLEFLADGTLECVHAGFETVEARPANLDDHQ